MSYKNTVFSVLFIIMILMLVWPTLFSFRQPNSVITFTKDLPDAFMEDVTAIIMDKEGNPKIKIETPKLLHFIKNDTTRLIFPHLTLYRQSPEPWHIRSNYARATEGIEHLNFWDHVKIEHFSDTKSPNTLIKTDKLTVYPNKRTAETEAFITMIQPNMVVTATGMFADMNSGDIKLLSEARGEYVPDA